MPVQAQRRALASINNPNPCHSLTCAVYEARDILADLSGAQVDRLDATISAEVAQSVERRTENPCVAGSNPALGTTIRRSEMYLREFANASQRKGTKFGAFLRFMQLRASAHFSIARGESGPLLMSPVA